MVENRPFLNFLTHFILIIGILIICFPVYIAIIASTHNSATFNGGTLPLLPGQYGLENYKAIFGDGLVKLGLPRLWPLLMNSFIMAIGISIGKITISLFSAYAIVYMRFPFRKTAFALIFITLMLPIEVRIIPTYTIVAQLGMINTYSGMIIPLIASATATFLFRQFFLTVPDELLEAARVDGAGPLKFFKDIVLPLSKSNIAALFIIMFIYGWIQYLWPLIATTDQDHQTVLVILKQLIVESLQHDPQWNILMAVAVVAMAPPVLVVIFMQRLFVKGLIETEK
ncbi:MULTISPECIES: sn-glycerol-3-phosphate ABC transporter permease UgpE [unclassified Bartonella]|uniref:sn-glycerol-3-phosphate ABC transporter permease UgpE n=1 Tax=unclassified Bartonella TaxID=2645622 RepID=UPI0009991FCF|nr:MULTISPECIES: sn-glycerol-3-phosphate ABC transporter permease UgpE [unclassified Bartonella]AQX18042.1 carbohydrate ABC transporter membrane protein 2,CUT1 family [Bartonella sp. A1379B]AQX22557.1 sn-glycerol 3-phosphate transport system permease protein [Bartonella sp. 11B]AQX24162.1 sn-glycerol 3-phosphate transport system permease protein [Bartonella sp. 114]AQX25006.1 carbohydrate ABC transporter membrane protein 2,CUT1 family [Bartonella sp. Coyote22sub2]